MLYLLIDYNRAYNKYDRNVNCSTTKPFRMNAALLPFIFIPFNTNTGLKDDKYNDG